MSWLKKVGQIALAVGKVSPIAGPILAAIIPGTKDDAIIARTTAYIDPVIAKILDVESLGVVLKLPGDQKLTPATPLVGQIFAPYAHQFGVADPALFTKGMSEIAQGYVDFLNSLREPAG